VGYRIVSNASENGRSATTIWPVATYIGNKHPKKSGKGFIKVG
jgi:hypothetical protein